MSFLLPAVVTAGGRLKPEVAAVTGTDIKALAPVGGVPLLVRVVRVLRACPDVGRIVVVGPKQELQRVACEAGADDVLEETPTGPGNVQAGLAHVRAEAGEHRVLLSASDVPFLTPDVLETFLGEAGRGTAGEADIVYPVITRADYDKAFPHSPNTWAKLAGVEYTGGSVFMVRPAALERNRELIARVFEARKSQRQMAALLGWGLALRFALGKLTVEAAEKRASELTGCRCVALRPADPRLAADVDTQADYEYADQFAKQKQGDV